MKKKKGYFTTAASPPVLEQTTLGVVKARRSQHFFLWVSAPSILNCCFDSNPATNFGVVIAHETTVYYKQNARDCSLCFTRFKHLVRTDAIYHVHGAVDAQETYYDAYKRARGVTYDDLRKQKLLTDRGAYMTFLEEKVTRLTASLLTVQGFDERSKVLSNRNELNGGETHECYANSRGKNTRDINNNDLGQGLGGQASKSMFGKSMLGKSSIVDNQVGKTQVNERLEIMEDMYAKMEKHIAGINNKLGDKDTLNEEMGKKFETMQKDMEEHLIRVEEQWELKFLTYKKELQRMAEENLRALKSAMSENKKELEKQIKSDLDRHKYDISNKQNDLMEQVRIQLDERNDMYVEDRVRFYNEKMQQITSEQTKQFNKHVDFMDKKIQKFYEKLEQDRKSEHRKHVMMVSREQSDWKNEVNDAQGRLRDYITSTIEENKRESERIWETQHSKVTSLINTASANFQKKMSETINKTKDIVEKEKAIIQTEHKHVEKDLRNQTHVYETKLLEHESKLEANLEENKRMYNEMQRLLNGVQDEASASSNRCINDMNQIKLSLERNTQSVIDIKKGMKDAMTQQVQLMK